MSEQIPVNSFRQKHLQKWLFVGLLIRLSVMPFTTHSDLLSIYQRAHLFLNGKAINGLGPNLFNIIHAGFLWAIKPFLPYSTMWSTTKFNTSLAFGWLSFVNHQSVFRELFLFKLPYLAVEVLVIWVLLKLVEPERSVRALAFWVLNPIVIFSTYIFGRFDMITVFLLLSAIYLAKLGRNNWALIVLGTVTLLRIYPIILIVPFALILATKTTARLRLAGLGFLPLLLSVFAGLAQGEVGLMKGFTAMEHLSYPLTMKFSLLGQDNLYVFVFLYSLIIMYLYVNPQPGINNIKRYSFYVLLLFFATSFFHPHYLIWLVPFVVFYFDRPQFGLIYGLHLAGWVIYTFQWGRHMAGYLMAPLSPAFFWSLMSPSEWIGRYYPAMQVIGIGRSLFSASCLAMAYMVWRRRTDGVDIDYGMKEIKEETVRQ